MNNFAYLSLSIFFIIIDIVERVDIKVVGPVIHTLLLYAYVISSGWYAFISAKIALSRQKT